MSNEAINWAFQQHVPMTRKFVLIVLANYADESHSCYPGQKKIAAQIGASVETVRRALVELERSGYISRERRNRDSGYRSSDRYYLPVNLPTGQFAHKADSGDQPGNLPTLTGQFEGANEPSGEPQEETTAITAATSKGSRLTDDFAPTEIMLAWARKNTPNVDVRLETSQFVDHHIAKGTVMKDWSRAWQTWMRNQQKWNTPRQQAAQVRNVTPQYAWANQ
ncbi:helix-turn-helix domain-containing protein [Paenarthrobacter nicotinovorans]|uniref:helix-turn-helix domain-containing protein n=1 Tax=Paenarthrobacter nicotinovorans TaxID=29320 RepID=UPI0038307CAE